MKNYISIKSTIVPEDYSKSDFIRWYRRLKARKRNSGQYVVPTLEYAMEYGSILTPEEVCRNKYRQLLEDYYARKLSFQTTKVTPSNFLEYLGRITSIFN